MTDKRSQLPLQAAKTCELHVHIGGSLFAADLLDLARDHYEKIDWSLFVDSFERTYHRRPRSGCAVSRGATQPTSRLAQGALRVRARKTAAILPISKPSSTWPSASIAIGGTSWASQKKFCTGSLPTIGGEGLRYVEYRAMAPYDHVQPEAFAQFHELTARAICPSLHLDDFTARYLISLPRWAPLECYKLVQRLLDENEDLLPMIVGLDFCHFEEGYPPASTRAFFRRLRRDNERYPERALDVAYHVGEVYFDKSLESAVRWCHRSRGVGCACVWGTAQRLGSTRRVAVSRRPQAHERELVSERLAQIAYDLHHKSCIGRIRHFGR